MSQKSSVKKIKKMKKIEVKYNGVVIGYTCDESKSIEFLDNEEALKIKEELLSGHPIGISSRQFGNVDGNGRVNILGTKEWSIVNTDKKT